MVIAVMIVRIMMGCDSGSRNSSAANVDVCGDHDVW